jgi:uncharacterized OsmC-like protein
MLGTFGGALEARGLNAAEGRLSAEVRGEVETEGGVLVLRRIHVHLKWKGPENARPVVERVHGFYADKCPVYRSLENAIEIRSSFEILLDG